MTVAKPGPVLIGVDDLAARSRLERGRVEWLFERAKVTPTVQGSQGRGRKSLWPADYVYLVRALDRLADLQCPRLWLGAVAAYWSTVDAEAVAGARYLVVSPSRPVAPVFLTRSDNLGAILRGCQAWTIDLLENITYHPKT